MPKWVWKLWQFVAHASQAWQIWLWVASAAGLPAMTGYLTNSAGLEPYQVLIATTFVFTLVCVSIAAIYHALLRREQWVKATSVAGQLRYMGAHLAYDFLWDQQQRVKCISAMNIGMKLINQSPRPINYKVEYFHARVEGQSPDTKDFVGVVNELGGGTLVGTHPGAILFGNNKKDALSGTMEFKILYGEGEKLEYVLERKVKIELFLKKELSIHPKGVVTPAEREQ